MSGGGRKAIAHALYDLVSQATGAVVGLKTSDMRLRQYTELSPGQMPALYLVQLPETVERTHDKQTGLDPKRTMHFEIWLYTSDAQASASLPIDQINDMVDAIETALLPSPAMPHSNAQTLGGLVASARLDGPVEYYDNALNSGTSIAILSVAVLRP